MAPSSKPVALVVGASRGIGRQVAIDFAAHGYAVVVAAKTVSDPSKPITSIPNPKSNDSTITTVSYEIRQAGGEAHPRPDVLIYNSGAIYWASVEDTPLKRFKLMQSVNPEGLYAVIQAALPHLKKSASNHSGTTNGGRIAKHVEVSDYVKKSIADLGLKPVASKKEDQSHAMTAIYLPEGVGATDVLPKLLSKGIIFAAGLHATIGPKYIRFGHMGVSAVNSNRGDIDKALNALKESLAECGYKA
ncbi:hypothetical protein NLG97_g8203 [Lecanicillium saksenae]|uniref:Uncharacterized protein n=1 Tax=Lecanicillium saksenae TaxID=468837 RepID=A0ACC1QMX4_9HYPO|nr:hypothetical protein NLG97_g8203 [Lecanicillium saksenae]